MDMERMMSCGEANQLDLVDYLEKLGHFPTKIRNYDYWFLSPLRFEKTPSFKVNRKLNCWYDHGLGRGGSLIDFALLYFNFSLKEVMKKLQLDGPAQFALFSPTRQAIKDPKIAKISILEVRQIMSEQLHHYLSARAIPLIIAEQYCCEIDFLLYGKMHTAIGFKNKAGGYELRNEYFKGGSSPKDVTLFEKGNNTLCVFEGFFDFLAWRTIPGHRFERPKDFLILNSLSFFERSRSLMEKYKTIHLFLDRDSVGSSCTRRALSWSQKYVDKSQWYRHFKDFNDWLVNHRNRKKEKAGRNCC